MRGSDEWAAAGGEDSGGYGAGLQGERPLGSELC